MDTNGKRGPPPFDKAPFGEAQGFQQGGYSTWKDWDCFVAGLLAMT